MRTVPNPAAAGVAVVAGGPPATIQVYAPWKPNDMLIILNGAPDKVKCPGRFVEFIGNMLDAYQAVSLDAWSLVRQSLNRTQWGKFLTQLGYNNHAAMEAVHPGVAGDEQRKTLLLAALEATLRKPIDLPKVLDQKPKRNEDPEDFLERFKDVYGSHAGDQNFNTGQQSPQFCATLMLCLPDGVGTSVKTNNLNWTGMTTPDMCRAVCALWKRGEAGDPPAKVKTEYVITREQPPKPKGPPHAETRGYQKEHQSCVPVWMDSQHNTYPFLWGHPNGPNASPYGPPYAPRGGNNQRPSAGIGWGPRKPLICYECGGKGHVRRDCPSDNQQGERRGSERGHPNQGQYGQPGQQGQQGPRGGYPGPSPSFQGIHQNPFEN